MNDILKMVYPASFWTAKWREAIALGNGHIGASVYGAVGSETVLLNHEELWGNTVRPELPDISDRLPVVRALLNQNHLEQAQDIMTGALVERGYKPKIACPVPLCDINVQSPAGSAFQDYYRQLDMRAGEALVHWADGGEHSRACFVSRADGVFVMRLRGVTKGTRITLSMHDRLNSFKPFGREQAALPYNQRVCAGDGFIVFSAEFKDCKRFGAVARIVGGDWKYEDAAAVCAAHGDALLLALPVVSDDIDSALDQARARLAGIEPDYDTLLRRHSAAHSALYDACTLDLHAGEADRTNEALLAEAFSGHASLEYVEKLWRFGRYLLISSSDSSGNPCSLLGLWHGDYSAVWAFNMLNENIQMTYWAALSGSLAQTELCMFDYYDSMIEDFKENAKKLYGCAGIYVPAVTTPGVGTIQCISRHILCWTAGAAWLAQHYYDYWLYTGDEGFLKDRALPFMKLAAEFYMDFFTLDENGYYVSSPSVSPENSPSNHMDRSRSYYPEVTMNATMDFAAVKELLTNLVQGCGRTGEDAGAYQEALTHIPPYQTNSDGDIREWMHPFYEDNYAHRHQSHIYPFFPGREIRRGDPLLPAFKRAIEKRLCIGISSQTSWSLAHMAHVWARLSNGDAALSCLDSLMRCFVMNNFFTVHNDWRGMGVGLEMPEAPFQIDANMGFTSAVNEMLLQSGQGYIYVLPALPGQWARGSVKNLSAVGAVSLDISWEPGSVSVVLTPSRDLKTSIAICGGAPKEYSLKAGRPVSILAQKDDLPC